MGLTLETMKPQYLQFSLLIGFLGKSIIFSVFCAFILCLSSPSSGQFPWVFQDRIESISRTTLLTTCQLG